MTNSTLYTHSYCLEDCYINLNSIRYYLQHRLDNMDIRCVEWDKFAVYLSGKGLSIRDLSKYSSMFNKVRNFFTDLEWNAENLDLFIHQLRLSDYDPKYINKYISFIKCHIEPYVGTQYWIRKQGLSTEDKIFDVLTPEEHKLLVYTSLPYPRFSKDKADLINYRYSVAIEIMAFFALRFVELQTMKWNQIGSDFVSVRRQKTGLIQKMDLIPYLAERIKKLQRYNHGFIFGSAQGRMKLCHFNSVIKKRCKIAGIDKIVTSHTMRRSFATNALDENISPIKVARYLGHKNMNTLGQYYNNSTKLTSEVLRAHPLTRDFATVQQPINDISYIRDKYKNSPVANSILFEETPEKIVLTIIKS